MKIAIIGYGKMGHEIEKIALKRGHEVVLKISSSNVEDLNADKLVDVDTAIEFTTPQTAIDNINICLSNGVPVVVGTTGWYEHFDEIVEKVKYSQGTLLHATNCSIGVNLFFRLNKYLSKIMSAYKDYEVTIDETHHTQKKDAPSGTAITLAEQILADSNKKEKWVEGEAIRENQLSISSYRVENVPGTHRINYASEIDEIEIKHTANNRSGFALGAVIASEFIRDKKGIFTMDDVLF